MRLVLPIGRRSKEVAEAEGQLTEIKEAALLVVNRFNKKDAENEE